MLGLTMTSQGVLPAQWAAGVETPFGICGTSGGCGSYDCAAGAGGLELLSDSASNDALRISIVMVGSLGFKGILGALFRPGHSV